MASEPSIVDLAPSSVAPVRAIRVTDETWRKLYAGLAMAGACWGDEDFEKMAHWAVKHADALLAELKRTEANPC